LGPPQAENIRGIVLGGMTLAERELVKGSLIRQACADEQLAIAYDALSPAGGRALRSWRAAPVMTSIAIPSRWA